MKTNREKKCANIPLSHKRDTQVCKQPYPPQVIRLLYTITALYLFFLVPSCSDDGMELTMQPTVATNTEITKPKTRSVDNGYWEDWREITINNGTKVTTPWNPRGCASAVPSEVLQDVKYDDGWEMIFPMSEQEVIENGQRDCPYLIFHNRYTGILKVFSYLQYNFSPTNCGLWQITTSSPSSLFAFQNTPISKITEKKQEVHYITNLTTNSTCGFSVGWNCFQIELAYDPTQSGMMTISTFALNKVKLTLDGNFDAETKGILSTQSNPAAGNSKAFANVVGNEAKNWVSTKIKNNVISSVVSEGIKAIVSGGVGKIIGCITGLFKQDESFKSLQLTTNGTISLEGEAEFISTTGITPLTFNINPDSIGYLGVWGLKKEPTLLFSPYAVLKNPQEHTNGYTREYRVNVVNTPAIASVSVNPRAYKGVKSSKVSTDYFQVDAYTLRNVFGSLGVVAQNPPKQKKVYNRYYNQFDTNSLERFGSIYSPSLYMIVDVAFKGNENEYLSVDQFEAPMEVFVPNVPGGPMGAVPQLQYNSNYIASVGVILTLPDGSEAHSYHQCIPQMDWNLSEYDNGLYWYFYPCEPVTQF